MASIDLAQPRTIAIEDRGRKFLLTLARITKKQWLRYFENIFNTSETQAGKRVDRFDSSSARLDLAESALIGAEGYGQNVTETEGWQKMIPLAHRLAAGDALVSVERGDLPEDEPFLLGNEAVFLNAVWSADQNGVMQKYRGLCHRFKTPTAEQQRRFSRDSSRSRIIGGSRKGVTQWLGSQATLAELYDELVVSVEGYTVNGINLGGERLDIVEHMDTFHKVAAADVLFSPAQPTLSEE